MAKDGSVGTSCRSDQPTAVVVLDARVLSGWLNFFAYRRIQMLKSLFNSQRVHFLARPFAGFQRALEIMPSNLNRQWIGNELPGALLILNPGRMRQGNPNRTPA